MHQRQFVFAVHRFRHLRRQRSQGAVAVGGEVGTVGGIDADHGVSPPFVATRLSFIVIR